MIRSVRILAAIGVVFACAPAVRAGDEAPKWMTDAIQKAPARSDSAAVVLLDDQSAVAGADGRLVVTRRYVVRIVRSEGREAAAAREMYLTDSGRIRNVQGWVVSANERTRELPSSGIVDVAAVGNDVYNEVRVRVLNASGQVEPGATFGAEIVSESNVPFRQLEWDIDRRWPVIAARRALTVPPGWAAAAVSFNTAAPEPRVSGGVYVWEFGGLDPLKDEPFAPPPSRVVPRLCVSYGPAGQIGFADWQAVARWLVDLSASRAEATPEVAAAARQVVGDAADPLERVRRIARFVQRLQYVSIQIGVGRGGGYQPRPAAEVLGKRYGDCKDKANLMRAMLKAIGVESFLMTAFLGDPHFVRAEWPSPQQFNHCILAIRLPAARGVARVEHPRLGPLLLFDATDPYTPLESLPDTLFASRGLLVVDDASPLVTLPGRNDAEPGVRREIAIVLAAEGSADVTQRDRFSAVDSVVRQAQIDKLGTERFVRSMESRAAAAAAGASQVAVNVSDGGADTTLSYRVSQFARRVGALLLVRPSVVRDERLPDDSLPRRSTPIELEHRWTEDTITIRIPGGFRVDETPPPVRLKTSFGEFEWSSAQRDGQLVISRIYRTRPEAVGPEEYAAVREFVQRVRAADSAAVVLAPGGR